MIRRLRAWWGRLPPLQQGLVGLGVPIVAGAALWANFRQRLTGVPAPTNGQQGAGTTGFLAVAPPTPIDTSAAGVAASDLGGFIDAFGGEVTIIEGRLAALEEREFGQTPGQVVTPEPIEIIVRPSDIVPPRPIGARPTRQPVSTEQWVRDLYSRHGAGAPHDGEAGFARIAGQLDRGERSRANVECHVSGAGRCRAAGGAVTVRGCERAGVVIFTYDCPP